MSDAQNLEAAEARVREAQAALERLTRQHEAAARELATLQGDLQRTSPENVALFARRMRAANAQASEVVRLEALIADASAEVKSAQAATRVPRDVAWAADARELDAATVRIREAIGRTLASIADTIAAVASLRRALADAGATRRRMESAERRGILSAHSDASTAHLLTERAAHELLRVSGLKPELLSSPELVAGLEQELRVRGIHERLGQLFRIIRAVA